MMRQIELTVPGGAHVAFVEIPAGIPPGVVTWGSRTFIYHSGERYVEAVHVVSLTPSPGLSLKASPPADHSKVASLRGTPVDELRVQQSTQPIGQHDDYIVLTDEERAKGFMRPVRFSYRHVGVPDGSPRSGLGCNSMTTMGRIIAETYARSPGFYSMTFCVSCNRHLPVGLNGEFVWEGTDERVGS